MATFTECFSAILTGDKDASRKAARQVRKVAYGSGEGDKFEIISSIIERVPEEYGKIKEEWRQENFVMAISVMYFLHHKREQPDFLFPWLFDLIQHAKGNIRYAAVRMLENELGPFTAHIRCPEYVLSAERHLTQEQASIILYELFVNLTELINDLWQPSYKKYKYVSSLPSGSYKSAQMALAIMEEYCGEDYMGFLEYLRDKMKK